MTWFWPSANKGPIYPRCLNVAPKIMFLWMNGPNCERAECPGSSFYSKNRSSKPIQKIISTMKSSLGIARTHFNLDMTGTSTHHFRRSDAKRAPRCLPHIVFRWSSHWGAPPANWVLIWVGSLVFPCQCLSKSWHTLVHTAFNNLIGIREFVFNFLMHMLIYMLRHVSTGLQNTSFVFHEIHGYRFS